MGCQVLVPADAVRFYPPCPDAPRARRDITRDINIIMSRPADEALADRIEKLAARVAKVGPQMEEMVKEKQGDSPDFAFLSGGEGAEYYAAQKQSAQPAYGGEYPPQPDGGPMLAPPPILAPPPQMHPPPPGEGGGYGSSGYGGGHVQ